MITTRVVVLRFEAVVLPEQINVVNVTGGFSQQVIRPMVSPALPVSAADRS